MIRKKLEVFFILLILGTTTTFSQRISQLKINEVVIRNTNGFQDEYGSKSGWIEIFNTAYATVNLGGCYITNDTSNLTKLMIPKGVAQTKIKPRQHLVLWADNQPTRGALHLNFTLDTTGVNTIYLVDTNGKKIIDSVSVKWSGNAAGSYGRCTDGVDVIFNNSTGAKESAWKELHIVTPGSNNEISAENGYIAQLKAQFPNGVGNSIVSTSAVTDRYKKNDPTGIGMSFIAMFVVFIALLVFYLIFKVIGNISINAKRKRMKESGIDDFNADKMADNDTGEIYAAIAMALYEMENDVHDWEETVLTIEKVTKNYSPWSSKIYGLREIPNKK